MKRMMMVVVVALLAAIPSTALAGKAHVVNINKATMEQLQLLPRIGRVTAGRIVQERSSKRFATIEDVTRVKGIGPKTLEMMRPFLTLKGRTTLASKVRCSKGVCTVTK